MSVIKGAEYPVSKIFSSDFEFHVPDYQRPYSWTTEQASELITDILSFMDSEGEAEKYFLGSIVLVKKDEEPRADVVDGQQRLTTLTILLSAVADALSGESEWVGEFDEFVREPGKKALKLEPKPRLFVRERDRKFYSTYIQTPSRFSELLGMDVSKLPEAQKNVVDNAKYFAEKLNEIGVRSVIALGQFIINNCVVVVVSTDSFGSAFRIFSVLNDRGLDLEPSDILKASVIGEIGESQRPAYTEIWEDLEVRAGRKPFNELIGHIRMIYRKEKARRSQLEEFNTHVVSKTRNPESLIDDVLVPYAEAFEVARNAVFESPHGAEKVNNLLTWLSRLNNVDWMPVAMAMIRKYERDSELLADRLSLLERLAASMFINGIYATPRIERYGKVLAAIENGDNLDELESPLSLSDEERRNTLYWLDNAVYSYSAKLRTYILLRLDSFLVGAGAVYQHSVTTIEHVLPQTVKAGSEWDRLWTSEEREFWINRVGNLLLLARNKNAEAQNYDFAVKKAKYFKTKTGVSPYATTTQILAYDQWTVREVAARQEELMSVFRKGWHL